MRTYTASYFASLFLRSATCLLSLAASSCANLIFTSLALRSVSRDERCSKQYQESILIKSLAVCSPFRLALNVLALILFLTLFLSRADSAL